MSLSPQKQQTLLTELTKEFIRQTGRVRAYGQPVSSECIRGMILAITLLSDENACSAASLDSDNYPISFKGTPIKSFYPSDSGPDAVKATASDVKAAASEAPKPVRPTIVEPEEAPRKPGRPKKVQEVEAPAPVKKPTPVTNPVDDEEEDDDTPPPAPTKKPAPLVRPVDDEEEDDAPPVKPQNIKPKMPTPKAVVDDDDDEDEAPKKPTKPKAVVDDDDDDDMPPPRKPATAPTKPKGPPAPEPDDDDDDWDDEDD